MPLVVQKHLPLLGLHMPAWPLHLQAGGVEQKHHRLKKKNTNRAGGGMDGRR